MEVEIKCFATLAEHSPPEGRMEVPPGSSVAQIMELLNVPQAEVHIIFINGVHAEPSSCVKQGDRVGLFPAVGGG